MLELEKVVVNYRPPFYVYGSTCMNYFRLAQPMTEEDLQECFDNASIGTSLKSEQHHRATNG